MIAETDLVGEAGAARAHPRRAGLRDRGLLGRRRQRLPRARGASRAGRAGARGDGGLRVALRRPARRRRSRWRRASASRSAWSRRRELADPLYARNEADRCYHCKTALFRRLAPLAAARGLRARRLRADRRRPRGLPARPARGRRRPACARRSRRRASRKQDVRALSRQLELPTAELPASPCLASRLPYGTPVTREALARVDRAESALRALGFRELRVRHLGAAARVEIAPEELARLAADAALREAVVRAVVSAGLRRGRDRSPGLPPRPAERGAARGTGLPLIPRAGYMMLGGRGRPPRPGGKPCSVSAFPSCSSSSSSSS